MTQAHIIFLDSKGQSVDSEPVDVELLTNEDLQFIALSPHVQLDLGKGEAYAQAEAEQDELPF